MKGVNTKVLGIDDEGNSMMMNPGGEYQFPGNDVYEIPMAQPGINVSGPRAEQSPVDHEGMNAMMKARLAYEYMHGNPAATRMVAPTDNPYMFPSGARGTHFMSNYDNYAIPEIQSVNGVLQMTGPRNEEAMRFDRPEDADYFAAENYKRISPAFIERELTDKEIEEYKRGGYMVEELPIAAEGMSVAPIIAEDGSVTCPEGYTWNPETRYCEKASPRPEGYTWDVSKQKYISDEPVKTTTTTKVIDPDWKPTLERWTKDKYNVEKGDPDYDKYYSKVENEFRSEARANEVQARKAYDTRVEAGVAPIDSEGNVIPFDEWKEIKEGCYGPYCVDKYVTTEEEVYDEKDREMDRIIPEYSYPEEIVPPEYQEVPVNPEYADYKGLRPPGYHAHRDEKGKKRKWKVPEITSVIKLRNKDKAPGS